MSIFFYEKDDNDTEDILATVNNGESGWYFYDETGASAYGPFESLLSARLMREIYCEKYLKPVMT